MKPGGTTDEFAYDLRRLVDCGVCDLPTQRHLFRLAAECAYREGCNNARVVLPLALSYRAATLHAD